MKCHHNPMLDLYITQHMIKKNTTNSNHRGMRNQSRACREEKPCPSKANHDRASLYPSMSLGWLADENLPSTDPAENEPWLRSKQWVCSFNSECIWPEIATSQPPRIRPYHITRQELPWCWSALGFFPAFKALFNLNRLLPTIHMAKAPGSGPFARGFFVPKVEC
jgi:hypothetical protein